MVCLAPSEFVDQHVARSFGQVAEMFIGADYLRNEVKRLRVFPLSLTEFVDFGEGFGNTSLYIAFLKVHHPRLSVSQLAVLSGDKGVKIPDIMTHDPPGRVEYYEIKPGSLSGERAGRTKIANIAALMSRFRLPYTPGVLYLPVGTTKVIRLFSGRAIGVDIRLSLQFERVSPGLIVYRVCVEGSDVVPVAVLLAAATVVLIIITRGRILRPLPGLVPA